MLKALVLIVVTAILLAMSLSDTAHSYSMPPAPTTTIHVLPADENDILITFECGINDSYLGNLTVKDIYDNTITETRIGSQVELETTVVNECRVEDKPLFVILEVRESDGVTTFLAWQNSTINAGEQVAMKTSWVAGEPGGYTVRAFYIGCLTCSGSFMTDTVRINELTVLQ